MRIAIVTKTFPPFSYGGTESWTEQLALQLSRVDGIEVHVICFQSAPVPVPDEKVEEYRRSRGFDLHIAGVHHKDSRVPRDIRHLLTVRKEMDRIITAIDPHVIQTVGVYSETLVAVSLARRHGIPSVVFPQGSDLEGPGGSRLRWIVRRAIYRGASLIMCQTSRALDLLVKWGYITRSQSETKGLVIPNAISPGPPDLPTGQRTLPETRPPSVSGPAAPPSILWIGRFEEVKRPADAVNLFRSALPSLPTGSRLIMIGDGSRWEAMRRMSQGDPSIVLTGRLYAEQIDLYLREATLLLNTSSSEGFPQTFLEAMSRGVPIVCPDVSANSEIIRDGVNGLVVNLHDDRGFVEAMVRLVRDEDLRSEISRENLRTVEMYSWTAVLPRILEAYQTLVSDRER